MNGLQTVDQWSEYFGHPKASILGVMNAVYPIGNLLGLPPATWLSDRYGRKVPTFVGIGLCIFGAALQAASQNLPMFIVARLLLGFSASVMALPSPILITELAYPIHRGKITSVYNTFYVRNSSGMHHMSSLANAQKVLWIHIRGMVNLWDVSNPVYMELEDPITPSGCDSSISAGFSVARTRIT